MRYYTCPSQCEIILMPSSILTSLQASKYYCNFLPLSRSFTGGTVSQGMRMNCSETLIQH
jgi:hypothetical protein